MEQLTKKQAKEFYDSEIWKDWTHEQIVRFQLFQELLCVPFDVFHKAVEKVLNRPVWTHEFAFDGLKKEYLGTKSKPTMEEIIDLIPKEKRMLIKI